MEVSIISELMINEQIRDREIRLIGEDGEQLGIMSARDAMKLARGESGSGEDRPTAKPPVCKIIDYGKYRYEQARKRTGTGKLKRMKAYKSHILTKKSAKRKRNLRQAAMTDATNVKTMKKIMPYL